MTSKVVITGFIVMAFVAGSIMTGTMAFGAEKPNGDPFKAIWDSITGLQQTLVQLSGKVTTLENKVNSLEENTTNCKNEYLIKGALNHDYELSPICESQLTPLSIDAGTDKSGTGVYTTTIYPNEENPDSSPAVVYEAHCDIVSDGIAGGSYLNKINPVIIATSNDGIYDIDVLQNSGIGMTSLYSLPTTIGLVAFALDSPEIPTPVPTAEEVIGTFTVTFKINVSDWYLNSNNDIISSDIVTYTCHP